MLVLFEVINEMFKIYVDRLIIIMLMLGMGVISRLCGEIFGFVLIFGVVKSVLVLG